jgi:hypothetical protein
MNELSQGRFNPPFTLLIDACDMKSFARLSVCILLLGACDTPSPEFWGVEPTRMHIAGTSFDIRIKDRKAEAIRLNVERSPRWMIIGAKAGFAIEKVSGCEIRKLGGDTAVVTAKLKCKGDREGYEVPRNLTYDCDIDDTYINRGLGIETTEMSCELVEG